MKCTYLLRSSFKTSYNAENSLSLLSSSLFFFARSRIVKSLTRTCCRTSSSDARALAASRDIIAHCVVRIEINRAWREVSALQLATSRSMYETSRSNSSSESRCASWRPSCARSFATDRLTSCFKLPVLLPSCWFTSQRARFKCSASASCAAIAGSISDIDCEITCFFFLLRDNTATTRFAFMVLSTACSHFASTSRSCACVRDNTCRN
mmetsp:Transcript_22206/g.69503  ORF Transcript_22206/g.69503 Transcript_22206/m.69503 type:complete len:209 (-) Transcript_22206:920-1546(-)